MSLETIATAGAVQTLPAAAAGTTLTPSGTAWVNGAYAEITASLSADSVLLGVCVTPGTSNVGWEIDIATGAASSEVVKATVTGEVRGGNHLNYVPLTLPIDNFASGARVAARIRHGSTNVSGWTIALVIAAKPLGSTITATTNPSKVYPAAADSLTFLYNVGVAWDNSSWQTIIASTADAVVIAGVCFSNDGFASTGIQYEVDLGIGGAGSETVLTTIRVGQVQGFPSYFPLRPLLDNVPASSRISWRVRGNNTFVNVLARLLYYEKTGLGDISNISTTLPMKWLPAAANPIAVPQDASDWVNGAYQQFSASLAAESQIAALAFATSAGPEHELDVSTGGAGSETVQGTIRLSHGSATQAGQHEQILPYPLHRFAASARLALRCRGNGSSTTGVAVAVGYYEGITYRATQIPVTWPAAATGVSLTPSGSAWVSSSWGTLVSATAGQSQVVHLVYTPAVAVEFELDLGVGGAGSEVVVQTWRGVVGSTIANGARVLPIILPYPIPAGTRVAVRMRKAGTDTTAWTISATAMSEVFVEPPAPPEGLFVCLLDEAWR